MSAIIENQKPNWEVGTAIGYHSLTYGWLIDQLLRRVDPKKRSLGHFFREEVAEPHGIMQILFAFITLVYELHVCFRHRLLYRTPS